MDTNEKNCAVLLTDAQEVKVIRCDPGTDTFDVARDAIGCEWIEIVEPEPLARDDMVLLIDEEGKLKGGGFINCILDENRVANAQLLEEAFYKGRGAEVAESQEPKETPNPVVAKAAESGVDADTLIKILGNPEMVNLLKALSKSLGGESK